jgi:hypothetical protein
VTLQRRHNVKTTAFKSLDAQRRRRWVLIVFYWGQFYFINVQHLCSYQNHENKQRHGAKRTEYRSVSSLAFLVEIHLILLSKEICRLEGAVAAGVVLVFFSHISDFSINESY